MKKAIFMLAFVSFMCTQTRAQLPNGSIAPDFTVTDINGNSHRLYDYLDQGKSVVIDFFAAHCPTCWSYHNQHHLKTLYEKYGPAGTLTQELTVLAIELDTDNGDNQALYGIGSGTAGNWVNGTPYPIINPEGALFTQIVDAYKAYYYPLIYLICPDKTVKVLGTWGTTSLYQQVGTCATSGIDGTKPTNTRLHPNPAADYLHLELAPNVAVAAFSLYNSSLHLLSGGTLDASNQIAVEQLPQGLYYLLLVQDEKTELIPFVKQ